MPTIKQKKAFDKIVENGGNISKAMEAVGYSAATAKTPQKLTESKGFQELMGSVLSDERLIEKHNELLNSTRIEHMVFPLNVTDDEIYELLNDVNCKVRKIMHGESAIHVWFWSADNKSRKDALDMAYKLKGSYAPEKQQVVKITGDVKDFAKYQEITAKYEQELLEGYQHE